MNKHLYLLLFIILAFTACINQSSKKPVVKTENIVFTEEVEDQEPPLTSIKTKYKSVQDWLKIICKENKPKKPIQTYEIGLFESPKENTLCLVGTNTYQNKNHSIVRIEFRPNELFYRLSNKKYQNLNHKQLQDKILSEVKFFLKTEEFKISFLSKANSVKVDFKGEIWKR